MDSIERIGIMNAVRFRRHFAESNPPVNPEDIGARVVRLDSAEELPIELVIMAVDEHNDSEEVPGKYDMARSHREAQRRLARLGGIPPAKRKPIHGQIEAENRELIAKLEADPGFAESLHYRNARDWFMVNCTWEGL